MLKNLIAVVVLATVASLANAGSIVRAASKEVHEMKDGSTIYVFMDGKMAMEDSNGRPTLMKEGVVLETKSGQKLVPNGNEVARLGSLLRKENGGHY